jgi:arginine/lysine/ornithine decarboxylase
MLDNFDLSLFKIMQTSFQNSYHKRKDGRRIQVAEVLCYENGTYYGIIKCL